LSSESHILYIKCNLVVRGSWFVVVVFYVPTVLRTTVQKLFENSFRRFRSRSLQRIDFKNASKKNSPQTDCQRDGACKRYKLAKLSVGDR
jgi:hypothetical protein